MPCWSQVKGVMLCAFIYLFSQISVAEEGIRSLAKGWAPTCIGYSMQGVCKFGFYEVFKILYSNLLGEENTYLYRTSLYLAASASAEFFADIALSPMEACKVRNISKYLFSKNYLATPHSGKGREGEASCLSKYLILITPPPPPIHTHKHVNSLVTAL